jgi:hypothetical protein
MEVFQILEDGVRSPARLFFLPSQLLRSEELVRHDLVSLQAQHPTSSDMILLQDCWISLLVHKEHQPNGPKTIRIPIAPSFIFKQLQRRLFKVSADLSFVDDNDADVLLDVMVRQ